MKTLIQLFMIGLLNGVHIVVIAQIELDSIPDGNGHTYIASPIGSGPFPTVLYNHGGLGQVVGGDLRGTVVALAEAGYLARAEKRMETTGLSGHLQEVETALDSLRADSRADTNCVSIMGFSRGGYLTLELARSRPHEVNSVIAMAPADPAGLLQELVNDVTTINDSVLILVANNDTFQGAHVVWAQMTYDSLVSTGKPASIIIYPDFDSNGDSILDSTDDGHTMFFEVQSPYWTGVLNFLNNNQCSRLDLDKFDWRPEIEIFPNPTRSSVFIEIEQIKNPCTLHVFSLSGRALSSAKLTSGKNSIQLPKARGLYILKVISSDWVHSTIMVRE